jgi:hypothetical protein
MLTLPGKIHRSVTVHRSNLAVFCDWLEATVLFDELEVSQCDVVDFLTEQHIYDEDRRDFCMEFVTDAWRAIRRRLGWIGSASPLKIEDRRVVRDKNWDQVSAHAFCLLLGLTPYYDGWTSQFGADYTVQGELFEKVVEASVSRVFLKWEVARTGWSRENTSKLPDVVQRLTEAVIEDVGNVAKYLSTDANEAGLDIFWHRRYPDERGGHPVFLAQCASGENWHTKLHTPEISVWEKLVDWKCPPNRAFAMPFALPDDEFVRRCNQFKGLFLDRYRLLMPASCAEAWLPDGLADEIIAWVQPRVSWLLDTSRA